MAGTNETSAGSPTTSAPAGEETAETDDREDAVVNELGMHIDGDDIAR